MREGSNGGNRISADDMEPGDVAIAFREGSPEAVHAVQQRVHRIVWFRGYRMREQDKKDLEQEIVTQMVCVAPARVTGRREVAHRRLVRPAGPG